LHGNKHSTYNILKQSIIRPIKGKKEEFDYLTAILKRFNTV
jgi:hypothetical protein